MLSSTPTLKTCRQWVWLFSGLSALLIFLPLIVRGGGILALVSDFNEQQIPFNMVANAALKSGNVHWNWGVDLGTPFVGAFSFYTLGSPFFWLSALFPAAAFPYLVGPLYILKYMVAAWTSFEFMRGLVEKPVTAVMGALLYAFSGFNTINLMFYHFHEVVAFFPLLLLGLDARIQRQKRGLFALAVGLNALTNYFFFFGQVLFLILYFVVRYLLPDPKAGVRQIVPCLLEGLLGCGLAAVLLLPSALFILHNPRSGQTLNLARSLTHTPARYGQLLKGALLPAELMHRQSAFVSADYSSSSLYLAPVGLSLPLAGLFLKKKNWVRRLLLVLLPFMLIPLLNSSFSLFNSQYYARWFYMPVLLMACLSAQALDAGSPLLIRRSLAAALTLTCGLVLGVTWLYSEARPLIQHEGLWRLTVALGLGGLVMTALILRRPAHRPHRTRLCLLAAIVLFSGLTGASSAWQLNRFLRDDAAGYMRGHLLESAQKLEFPDGGAENYRIEHDEAGWNLALLMQKPTVNSFCSTVSPGIFEFYHSLLEWRQVTTFWPEDSRWLAAALSVRFHVTRQPRMNQQALRTFHTASDTLYVYENPDFIGLGYGQTRVVNRADFDKLVQSERLAVLMQALVVDEADFHRVSQVLQPLTADEARTLDPQAGLLARQQDSAQRFQRDHDGFEATLAAGPARAVFFSVPWDPGWQATLNGRPVEIIKSLGLMAVLVPEGVAVNLSFRYRAPGQSAGVWLSLAALAIILLLLWQGRQQKRAAASDARRHRPDPGGTGG